MVALDMGGDDVKLSHEFLSNLDFILPNESELQRLLPNYDPIRDGIGRLRKEILEKYPKLNFIIHMGAEGSMFVNLNHNIYMPIVSKFNPKILDDYKIIDTTGAGNSYPSSLLFP